MAAYNGHIDVCEFIIDNIGDKKPTDNQGFTHLHIAVQTGHLDIYKLIIDKVENKNPTDYYLETTPYHLAAQYAGHFETCKFIFENMEVEG